MRFLRSVLFFFWLYGLMAVFGLFFLPMAIWSRAGAYFGIRVYLRCVFWGLRVFCGLTAETRGPIPQGDVLIAAKHQSFLDVLVLLRDLPAARFVMKRSLIWAPMLGFYALRIGASPVTRGRGWASVGEMMREIERRRDLDGQLVIFPQGTRVKPGEKAPYKPGSHLVYRTYGLPCIPAAANTGHFWPRRGVARKPGVAVIEFMEPLPEGLSPSEFVAALEERIEPATERLAKEARDLWRA
ncbi:1-acyl-sn-glycerol-3-phosphate acyltransferase [Pikeienuella piscinae]|uniref:1-acyl-sn-glycerol-3-phosphate acyltransferase n=1 Tax=Pikeienuella piscinae TaxID=2748098 RepID=A0A7L5BYT9_9RHOB|nr:lysophospholipid acyltransferase family protein [Pikeienuella piscinae]QIE54769.1 1-acyl-sn-glycerol-3-phosphate acyltransferase [Pikeienuella piscinae]